MQQSFCASVNRKQALNLVYFTNNNSNSYESQKLNNQINEFTRNCACMSGVCLVDIWRSKTKKMGKKISTTRAAKEEEGRTLWLDTQSHASSNASSADDDYAWQWPTSFWSQFKVCTHIIYVVYCWGNGRNNFVTQKNTISGETWKLFIFCIFFVTKSFIYGHWENIMDVWIYL